MKSHFYIILANFVIGDAVNQDREYKSNGRFGGKMRFKKKNSFIEIQLIIKFTL